MNAEDFLKEDLDNTNRNNEVIEPVSEEVMAILRKHNLDIRDARKVLNNINAKLRRLQEGQKV